LDKLPEKDAAECQRQWAALYPTPVKKRAGSGRKQGTAKRGGKATAAAPLSGATEAASPTSPAHHDADSASPAARAAGRARPRAYKPCLRELFAAHEAAGSAGIAATVAGGSAAAAAQSIAAAGAPADDDIFEASPFKAVRQQEEAAVAAAAAAPRTAPSDDEVAAGVDGPAVGARTRGGRKQAARSTAAATHGRSVKGRGPTSVAAAASSTHALLHHLRNNAAISACDLDAADGAGVDAENVADSSVGVQLGGSKSQPLVADDSAALLLGALPDRSKTDAYVKSFQRVTRHGASVAAAIAKKVQSRPAKQTQQPSGSSRVPSHGSAALRKALREQDARALTLAERTAAAEEDAEDGGADYYFDDE
jgi:hypothetical protein